MASPTELPPGLFLRLQLSGVVVQTERQPGGKDFRFPMPEDPREHMSVYLVKIAGDGAETNTLAKGKIPLNALTKVLCCGLHLRPPTSPLAPISDTINDATPRIQCIGHKKPPILTHPPPPPTHTTRPGFAPLVGREQHRSCSSCHSVSDPANQKGRCKGTQLVTADRPSKSPPHTQPYFRTTDNHRRRVTPQNPGPPPKNQRDHGGKKRKLQGKSDWAILCTQNFGSQNPPPLSSICYTELIAVKTVGQAQLELIAVKQT